MHWGHAITKDMIKWEYLPVALAPDCTFDDRGCFSGSAVTYDGKHYIAYTGVSCGEDGAESQSQCIAAGDGLHYHKESHNPVITAQLLPGEYSSSHFRDPKMWQDEDGLHMIVGCLDQNKEGHLAHFCSTDMKHWHFEGMFLDHIPGLGRMWECPDFFSLQGQDVVIISPQDMAAQPPEIHNGNNSLYILGTFERNKGEFEPYKTYALDYGLDFYAAQTVTLKDQRVILIAWMQSWDSYFIPEELSWAGMMTVPRELCIKNGRLYQSPVRELEGYQSNQIRYSNIPVTERTVLPGIEGRVLDLTVELKLDGYRHFEIRFAEGESHYCSLHYDKIRGQLCFDRTFSGLVRDVACTGEFSVSPVEGKLTIRILLDNYSSEFFINGGEKTFAATFYTDLSCDGISFHSDGEAHINVEKYNICVSY